MRAWFELRHSLQVLQHPAKARGQWGVVTPCHATTLAFPLGATLGPARGSVTVHTSPFACLGGLVLTHCSPPEGHLGRSSGRTPGSRYGHMLPMRRDSGQPHRFFPKDAPAQAFTLRCWALLGQPKCRGCILTNPSIPALGYGANRGRTFLLAPIKGSSSTIMREMLGGHTHRRGNGTTPTAAVVRYMSSVAQTPGSPQWQPLGAIRAGCSLCHRQGQPVAPLAGSPPGPHCTCPFCGLAALGTSQGEWHHPCRGSLGHDQRGQVIPGSSW